MDSNFTSYFPAPPSHTNTLKDRNLVKPPSARTSNNAQKSPIDGYFHRGIVELFKKMKAKGNYSETTGFQLGPEVVVGVTPGADVEAFMLAYNIFIDGLQIIACPTNYIVHRTFWGTGMGQIDTKSTHKSGKHNVDFIPAKILSASALKLRQAISSNWRKMNTTVKYQVLLLYVWANKVENCIITHCNVLVVKRVEDNFEYHVFEPAPIDQKVYQTNFCGDFLCQCNEGFQKLSVMQPIRFIQTLQENASGIL